MVQGRTNVHCHEGDCNEVLLRDVFPRVRHDDFSGGGYKRALCILDPYGLSLDWNVVAKAGSMGTFDILINFPIYDININVLHRDRTTVLPIHADRMNAFWGNESWRDVAYEQSQGLFGVMEEKVSNERFAEAFRRRLREVAGFKRVPEPLPMRNSNNSVVYYLFFASQKNTAEHIIKYIFDKFGRGKG